MKRKILLVVALILVTTGCVTSSFNYTPPTITEVDNQIVIGDPYDEVWDRLVKNLASDFFVINDIEKNSGIIDVSFSSNTPTEFVSCGVSVRKFTNKWGTQVYEYDPASSTQYTLGSLFSPVFDVVRNSRLNGRTNIYVAPSDEAGTTVSVDTKYVVDVTLSYTDVVRRPAGSENFTFDFSTKQPQVTSDGITCVARGNLEDKILDYAR